MEFTLSVIYDNLLFSLHPAVGLFLLSFMMFTLLTSRQSLKWNIFLSAAAICSGCFLLSLWCLIKEHLCPSILPPALPGEVLTPLACVTVPRPHNPCTSICSVCSQLLTPGYRRVSWQLAGSPIPWERRRMNCYLENGSSSVETANPLLSLPDEKAASL